MFGNNGQRKLKEGPLAVALPYLSAMTTVMGLYNGIKSLSAKTPKMPDMPQLGQLATSAPDAIDVPKVMPVTDSALTAEAKRRQIIAAQERGGRASTILTDDNEKFGG